MANMPKIGKLIMYVVAAILNVSAMAFYIMQGYTSPCITLAIAFLAVIYAFVIELRPNTAHAREKKLAVLYLFASMLVLSMGIYSFARGASLMMSIMFLLSFAMIIYCGVGDIQKKAQESNETDDAGEPGDAEESDAVGEDKPEDEADKTDDTEQDDEAGEPDAPETSDE